MREGGEVQKGGRFEGKEKDNRGIEGKKRMEVGGKKLMEVGGKGRWKL